MAETRFHRESLFSTRSVSRPAASAWPGRTPRRSTRRRCATATVAATEPSGRRGRRCRVARAGAPVAAQAVEPGRQPHPADRLDPEPAALPPLALRTSAVDGVTLPAVLRQLRVGGDPGLCHTILLGVAGIRRRLLAFLTLRHGERDDVGQRFFHDVMRDALEHHQPAVRPTWPAGLLRPQVLDQHDPGGAVFGELLGDHVDVGP